MQRSPESGTALASESAHSGTLRSAPRSSIPLPTPQAFVRQILGRPSEIWGAESGVDKLVVIRTR